MQKRKRIGFLGLSETVSETGLDLYFHISLEIYLKLENFKIQWNHIFFFSSFSNSKFPGSSYVIHVEMGNSEKKHYVSI